MADDPKMDKKADQNTSLSDTEETTTESRAAMSAARIGSNFSGTVVGLSLIHI